MNDTLREFLDQFCVVYIDDILIYSKNKKEHREHVRRILAKLKEAGLYANAEKCEFNVEKTTFLGFIISADGVVVTGYDGRVFSSFFLVLTGSFLAFLLHAFFVFFYFYYFFFFF